VTLMPPGEHLDGTTAERAHLHLRLTGQEAPSTPPAGKPGWMHSRPCFPPHPPKTSNVHDGARWYDPKTGAFAGQDTNSYLANPANGNRYAYAADDPEDNIDPTGADVSSLLDDYFGFQAVEDVAQAPTLTAALGVLAGVVTGVVVEAACNVAIGALEAPTGGLSTLAEPACAIGGVAAGNAVTS
jgi:RHS repeat-associated protein